MRTEYKKMTSHGSVSIPVAMRRALDIEAKDPLMLEEKGGQIVMPLLQHGGGCAGISGERNL